MRVHAPTISHRFVKAPPSTKQRDQVATQRKARSSKTPNVNTAVTVAETSRYPKIDWVRNQKAKLLFKEPKDFSGHGMGWQYLQTHEVTHLFCAILPRILAGDETAIAIACCYFLGRPPSEFGHIPIRPEFGATAWLDLDSGFVAWDLRVASRKTIFPADLFGVNDRTTMLIPLPAELVVGLQKLRTKNESAQRLSQLFTKKNALLDQSVKALLKANNMSSHTITTTKLRKSSG